MKLGKFLHYFIKTTKTDLLQQINHCNFKVGLIQGCLWRESFKVSFKQVFKLSSFTIICQRVRTPHFKTNPFISKNSGPHAPLPIFKAKFSSDLRFYSWDQIILGLHCWGYMLPRFWNTGLVSSRASLTSRGEGASLALVGLLSSDGVTIKMPYGVDALHRPALHPIFSYWVG